MWLSDFKVVLPDTVLERGSVQIEGDRIAAVVDGPMPGGIDGAGRTLMPGFIDMHGDMVEQEIEPRPKVDFPMAIALPHLDARLAASGVTTAYASVSFTRGASGGDRRSYEHTSRTIREVDALRREMRIDHKIHARFDITLENADSVLAELVDSGCVDLVSLMDHTPGQGQYRDLERHVAHLAHRDGIDPDEARRRVDQKRAAGARSRHRILSVLETVSEMCRAHGVPLASHDDDSVDKARLMAGLGTVISEFPVTIEAAREATAQGMMVAMGAPNAMRGASYSGNLSAREAHAAGLLRILAADYHPAAILPAIRILAETDAGGLAGAVALATANPADALGLTDRGRIATGGRADLAVVETGAAERVVATFSAGRMVHSTGSLRMPDAQTAAIA